MKRRSVLTGGLVAAVAAANPAQIFARPRNGSIRDRVLFDIARRELDRAGDAIRKPDIVGIADFALHSSERRFHIINLDREEVQSCHVSHGKGSDPEHGGYLKHYSNAERSLATSRGAYVTRNWYSGRIGASVLLSGLDETNEAALRRSIVIRHANYAEPAHIDRWGRPGRSNGSFAMGEKQFRIALMALSGGRLLFADSLGLQADGGQTAVNLVPLQPERPNLFQRTNPGAY